MKNPPKNLALLVIPLLLWGCTTPEIDNTSQGDAVKVTDKVDSMCKFLDVAVGTGEDTDNDPEELFEAAMRRARYNAFKKGATHVILQGGPQFQYDRDANVHRTTVVVNAYDCKK